MHGLTLPLIAFDRKIKLSLLVILFSYAGKIAGQDITFTLVPPPTSMEHLGVGTVDTAGYVWFATSNGLLRYDGYRYTSFINDPADSTTVASNKLITVYAARDGSIWVGTETMGLDRLDPATGIFAHFRHDPENDESLSSDKIISVIEDDQGNMWIGTKRGLNRLDLHNRKITRFVHDPQDTNSLSNNDVRVIYQDRNKTIWIGTGGAFAENPGHDGGLNRFSPETGTFTHYMHDPADEKSLIDNRVGAIFEDKSGTLWVGTAGDGLHTMDREKAIFTRHTYDPLHPEKLSRPPLKKYISWADDQITFITQDSAGAIWIGTLMNGVCRYDQTTKAITHYEILGNNLSGNPVRNYWWTISTKDGILWLGTWGDAFQTDPLRKTPHFVSTAKNITCMYQETGDILWYGTLNSGLIRHSRISGLETKYVHNDRNPNSLSDDHVLCIYKDSRGQFWVATEKGLHILNEKSGTFKKILFPSADKKFFSALIFQIIEDREHRLWFSCNGLLKFDPVDGSTNMYRPQPGNIQSLKGDHIRCLYLDKAGNIWIGYYSAGVDLFNPYTGQAKNYLYGATIYSIIEDSKGIVWIGTENGLYYSDPMANHFVLFHDPQQRISANISIGSILEDDDKNLWISSWLGILKINERRDQVLVHTKTTDFQAHGYKGLKGELFFGGSKGYYSFFPHLMTGNPIPPQIEIRPFFYTGDGASHSLYVSNINRPGSLPRITLPHNLNVFSFSFTGIHFGKPEHNRHVFMLEKIDKTWRKAGADQTAYYSHVPPGKYNFHVRAYNSDDVWSEKSIQVIITPPWWQTWWAYTSYALIAVLAIWMIVKIRIRSLSLQLEHQNRELQIQELRRQKTEIQMQALRAQMNPHFIFNSLNSINRFILKNNREDASEYLSKFSKLIRLILNHSQASVISLENEVEALTLYLDLEALRFDNHFAYSIQLDPQIDAAILKVPPLLLQPYAENAIWHGLMQKNDKGRLDINIFIEHDLLVCKIRDDGIGRKRANEIKNESKSQYQSKGMNITASRIDLLHKHKLIHHAIEINDLVYADSSPAGTEVIIKLPLTYD